ncbi:MAG: efflux RND transporter periplasmic adaptor subunit [Kordiimonadaceae bacterium]|nr:efflux RND transporter periplasmic adaptor subunit [Kordiimonadaceae bacterium]
MNIIQRIHKLAIITVSSIALTGCGDTSTSKTSAPQMEEADQEYAKGPNGGRLLADGDFAVEVTIFEQGRPPQFRLFAYENNELVAPNKVNLEVTLTRLDGEENHFTFAAEADYLAGAGVVTEPHSFDVTVKATYNGRRHSWKFASYEGRTRISAKMATEVGIKVEPVGKIQLEQTLDVLGRIEFAPNAKTTLRARFPGKILDVTKYEGQSVKKGEVLARIESNESLQTYTIKSPMDGVIVNSQANIGDVVFDTPLFVIGDLSRLRVDFRIYPMDFMKARPGKIVYLQSIDGNIKSQTTLEAYLPSTESATQTMIVHASLPNPDLKWLPGMTVKGTVVTDNVDVPLAVRTKALQRFRDFTVVFAQVGEEYEVRMLVLGRSTPEWTEVISGIKPGQNYVTGNSFLIKADIEKSGASHDH